MQPGDIIYNWIIIDSSQLSAVKVQCKCGKERVMRAWNIRNGSPQMCRECYNIQKIKDSLLPIGTQLYDWIIISSSFERKKNKTGGLKQHVRCKCGYETFLELSPLKSGRTKSCRECSSQKRRKYYKDIPSSYIRQILEGANKRGYNFNVDIQTVWSLLEKQKYRCALSGVAIDFQNKTASLDRIDSTKGYIEGNIQWVHKTINQMKSNRSDRDFIDWCRKVTEFNS